MDKKVYECKDGKFRICVSDGFGSMKEAKKAMVDMGYGEDYEEGKKYEGPEALEPKRKRKVIEIRMG